MTGLTFDAGGLIALERGDRHVIALIEEALDAGFRISIPAAVLAQTLRQPARQARLRRLLGQQATDVIALDEAEATAVGMLLARSRSADIVDAHVAVCARRSGDIVVTSDAVDLLRLDPELRLVEV